MRKNFGAALKKSRESHNLTREQLAKKTRVSDIYIAHLENKNPAAPVSFTLYDRLKTVLNLSNEVARLAELHNNRVRRYRNARRKAA